MGRREKAEKGRVRGRKNKPKKAKFVCKKKETKKREKRLQPKFCSPPRKKSCPKEKAGLRGVGCLSGLRPVLRHIDLVGKDLACPSVC